MAVRDDRSDVKQTTTGFRGPLMVQSLTSAKSKFLSLNKCYWITGLSATGKTTLSKLLVEHFRSLGRTVVHLDGDEMRQILSDQAYTRQDRIALGMRY